MRTITKALVMALIVCCSPVVDVFMAAVELLTTPYRLIRYAYRELEKR